MSRKRTVLLTGFDAFGGDAQNPAGVAVTELARTWTGPEDLVTAVLPVVFDAAATQLRALIAEHDPAVVLAVGLAGGRDCFSPERIAVNLQDARIPDNSGAQPIDEPSVAGAPAAYFSTLPVKAIAHALRVAGLPAAVSHSAGTFVCNHVFFVAAHEAGIAHERRRAAGAEGEAEETPMRAGFLHVPWSREAVQSSGDLARSGEQPAGTPAVAAVPAADIVRALSIAVRTALDVPEDLRGVPTGSVH